MRSLVLLGLVILTTTISAATKAPKSKKCTKKGYWGDNCSKLCGECKGDTPKTKDCDKVSGKCKSGKCEDGWTDKNAGQNKCDDPKCFGEKGCDHEGECIAPNYCKCTGGGAMGQVIGRAGLYANDKGEMAEGIECISFEVGRN